MIARAGVARLTPSTTGRDNLGTLINIRYCCLGGITTWQQCQGPQDAQPLRALVILRDGLTYTQRSKISGWYTAMATAGTLRGAEVGNRTT